ncbi:MAG: hypothetical protein A2020_03700 [Lentisphaerae bacterium GWF2_45_14]|nr:MAG: hypothetical protein A2020_03700 [Lentisphaerae bacterium GWF2_45_14]
MNGFFKTVPLMLIVIGTGCNSLPEGQPPEGTIVEQYNQPERYSPKQAVNQMLTSITTRCEPVILAGAYVLTVKKDFKAERNEENRLPDQLAAELVKMKSIRTMNLFPDAKYDWVLKSTITHGDSGVSGLGELVWEMKFISHLDGKVYWQEKLIVQEKSMKDSRGKNETHIVERKRDKGGAEKKLP